MNLVRFTHWVFISGSGKQRQHWLLQQGRKKSQAVILWRRAGRDESELSHSAHKYTPPGTESNTGASSPVGRICFNFWLLELLVSEVRRADLLFVWITVSLYFSELRKSLDTLSINLVWVERLKKSFNYYYYYNNNTIQWVHEQLRCFFF